jgi:hypothetical protein
MTIFGGYYELTSQPDAAGAEACIQLERLLRDMGAGAVEKRRRGRFFIAWFDGGAFPDPGFAEDADGLCLLAGDPIHSSAGRLRNVQAAALAAAGDRIAEQLARCAGAFVLLRHSLREEKLVLATDALGVRPVYFGVHQGRLYFSSCLSVLERLDCLPLTVSAQGLFEFLAFQYNLDGKTPYREVRVLRQGEMLTASPAGITQGFYHRWDRLTPVELDYPDRVRRIYELFRQAVERRCWRSTDAVAMLSGGLDSRMNVGVLSQLGRRVVAINCVPEEGEVQDGIYAGRVAAALGCELVRVPIPPGPVKWGHLAREGLRRMPRPLEPAARRLVFSGDGGSVGIGLVYHEPETVGLLRQGRAEDALALFLAKHSTRIPGRYLQQKAQPGAYRRIRETALALLTSIGTEPGRWLHLFLMQNDQRCHLHPYFEEIGEHGHEPLLPFYDSDLLRFVLACPVDDFLRHRLYHDLVAFLPEPLSRIPRQTYPGHLPCPVPGAEEGHSQFSSSGRRILARKEAAWPIFRLVFGPSFPSPPFRRLPVLATAVASLAGWRRFGYVHAAITSAARFLKAARGRFAWDLISEP